jgi:hypothetical protein
LRVERFALGVLDLRRCSVGQQVGGWGLRVERFALGVLDLRRCSVGQQVGGWGLSGKQQEGFWKAGPRGFGRPQGLMLFGGRA